MRDSTRFPLLKGATATAKTRRSCVTLTLRPVLSMRSYSSVGAAAVSFRSRGPHCCRYGENRRRGGRNNDLWAILEWMIADLPVDGRRSAANWAAVAFLRRGTGANSRAYHEEAAEEPMVCKTLRRRGIVWTPSAGQGRFWLGTVMPVAGLCPACSRGNAAGLDGLSASRGSHLDFALDAHPLAAGLPR